jgi:uncharacterized protein (TIGR00730 family)
MTVDIPQTPAAFSVCVYCGARPGKDPAYPEAARQMGRLIAQRGWRLVYGGAQVGLMGEVANAALAAGGTVLGVIPERLHSHEIQHPGLSELVVVRTMHERKQRMAQEADAFVALPGGVGTLEELFEIWTWRHIGYHARPIGLLNVAGYYDPLLQFMAHTQAQGFVDAELRAMLCVATAPAPLLDTLWHQHKYAQQRHPKPADDYHDL